MSFGKLSSLPFWIATFSLSMVLIFENMGLLHGLLEDDRKFPRAYQANAISAMTCGLFGTSPTVSTVESAAGITAGGKTGLTSIVTGLLFFASLFALPFVKLIPDSAIAPILIIIGTDDYKHSANSSERFFRRISSVLNYRHDPATYSIADGIAFGFIAYPILKVALGKRKEVAPSMYIITCLFLAMFVLHAIG